MPFYLLIPRVPVTQVLGQINITNKSLVYVVGLQVSPRRDNHMGLLSSSLNEREAPFLFQLLTSSPFMWLLALSGLVSGPSLGTGQRSEVCSFAQQLSRLCFQLSGALYRSNLLWIQKLLFAPMWMSRVGRWVLEPLFSSESDCCYQGKLGAESRASR